MPVAHGLAAYIRFMSRQAAGIVCRKVITLQKVINRLAAPPRSLRPESLPTAEFARFGSFASVEKDRSRGRHVRFAPKADSARLPRYVSFSAYPVLRPRAWRLGRTDVGKQLLRKFHAARNMALFADVKVQGEYGPRATVLDPSHKPAHRRTHTASRRFIIDTDQSRFGADHRIPDFGNGKNIAY